MSTYLVINICIVLIPLLLSFEKNVRFYTKLKNVFSSVIVVGLIFLIWDSIATKNGDWSFNSEYTGSIKMFGLPLEEILFFITVPYSIILIYESLTYYLKDRTFDLNKNYFLVMFVLFVIAALVNINKNYTATVLIFCSIIFLFLFFYDKKVYTSRISVLTILISYIPFLVVNYILTSLPIVEYNPDAILGIRITTIPIEDFFYSFAMISGWLIVYNIFKGNDIKLKSKSS